MINPIHVVLLERLWQRDRRSLLLFSLGLFGFWLLIVALYPSYADMQMEQMMEALPPFLQNMFGSPDVGFNTLASWIVVGFNHPLVVLVYGAMSVIIGTAAIAGEVSARTADALLATPMHRLQVVWTNLIFLLIGSFVLSAGVFFGIYTGLLVAEVEMDLVLLARICINATALYLSVGALSLAVSAFLPRAGRASGVSSLVIAVMFIVNFLADVWSVMTALQPLSLFAYFDVEAILVHDASIASELVVLTSISLLLAALAHWRLNRIDL